jgi:broad specificity phosphatase PhoE
MTTLLLIRHGETEWNKSKRWQGHADVPLSADGGAQAKRLAARIREEGWHIDHVYASDLSRAFETAQVIAAELGVSVHPRVELREIHVGVWSGMTNPEIRERYPEMWALYESGVDFQRGDDGETMAVFRTRVSESFAELVSRHPGERLLIVTHGGNIRTLLEHVQNLNGEYFDAFIENTSVTEISWDTGHPVVVRINDALHLESARQEPSVAAVL